MALPSGTIRLSEVMAEFGGATPPNWMQAYLKGGAYVTTHDYAPNVPTDLSGFSLRDFCGAYKVTYWATIDPAFVGGVGTGEGEEVVTTDIATVTVHGGTAPYTYSWAQTSGDSMFYTKPAANTVCFYDHLFVGAYEIATFRCTVTDAASATCTVDITATLEN